MKHKKREAKIGLPPTPDNLDDLDHDEGKQADDDQDVQAALSSDYAASQITHAGIAVRAADTGNVLMAQRAYDETDDPAVQNTWEFPGGSINPAEDHFQGAAREFTEETGHGLPQGDVTNEWNTDNYHGFVYTVPEEFSLDGWECTDECQGVGWISPEAAQLMDTQIRPELDDFDWSMMTNPVSGNSGQSVTDPDGDGDIDFSAVPVLSMATGPIPVHGVAAPEGEFSGDGRYFAQGAITTRPLRLPFSWQRMSGEKHGGSVVVGSVDRLMRKDGLIHWEGLLMPDSMEADEFTAMLAFFGRYGVSIDGDRASFDQALAKKTGNLIFDSVRFSGLTAVAIPAFSQAYVELGPHPDMPNGADHEVMVASGNMVGGQQAFDRGPGWATHPEDTRRIHAYWTEKGKPGYNKIAWGKPGDFSRCVALVGEKIAEHSPNKSGYVNRVCAQWHHDALGIWPSTHAKDVREGHPVVTSNEGNWTDVMVASVSTSSWDGSQSRFTLEQWKRSCVLDRGGDGTTYSQYGFPIREPNGDINVNAVHNAAARINQAKASSAAIGKAKAALRDAYSTIGEQAPDSLKAALEEAIFTAEVLTASAGGSLPPLDYFSFHPDTGALVIEEPDENGYRRTFGYAGEWGVCHIGYDGQCVEAPRDPDGSFAEFHLGRTRTADGDIATGLITYATMHRGAAQILTETATRAHYEDINHAWAAVRLGQDERGIWFSGVVLPHITEDDLVVIQAAGQVSGEWKFGSLRTLLSVSVPGLPVKRESSAAYDSSGRLLALAASMAGSECPPTPAERMAALREIDAQVRFQKLRESWSA